MKKLAVMLLAAVMLVSAMGITSSAQDSAAGIKCGDANGDGEINTKDVSALIGYCVESGKNIEMTASDANNDGKISLKDAATLMKYIAGWKVLLSIDDLENCTDIMKKSVLESKSEYEFAEVGKKNHIYYVSSSEGDDLNSGLSPDEPLETLETVEYLKLKMGDVILFKRGDEFRGKLPLKTGITYSSYGEGAKPILNGSEMNYADESLWVETEYENIYKCKERLNNVGNIVFDFSGVIGSYDEKLGRQRLKKAESQTVTDLLTADLDFYSDLDTNDLYLYSTEGNPGERFSDIEVCFDGAILSGNEAGVTIDNLCFMFSGGHGVGCGSSKNLTVKNCVFCWIGGSVLKGFSGGNTTRYGNAVEIFGSAEGYYVYNNWMYQIYDTGVTHQYSYDDSVIYMRDIEYADNLIEYCSWGIEFYNYGREPSCMENIHVHDNLVRYNGYGWKGVNVASVSGAGLPKIVNDFVIEDNIFAYANGYMIFHYDANDPEDCNSSLIYRHNTYIQNYGMPFVVTLRANCVFDENAEAFLRDMMHEENPRVLFADAK